MKIVSDAIIYHDMFDVVESALDMQNPTAQEMVNRIRNLRLIQSKAITLCDHFLYTAGKNNLSVADKQIISELRKACQIASRI